MDTKSIRLFVLAAEKLNISAAGQQLGMAPAVASNRLAKLERSLGADLLHRSTRQVTLSREGAEFLPYATEMLAQEDAGMAALGLGHPAIFGTLRFTAPSSFAQLYIAPLIPDFMDLHPAISLEMHLSDSQYNLIEGGFDLALRNSEIQDMSLKCRKLADDKRVLCASPDYLRDRGKPKTPEDLADHQLIGLMDLSPRPLMSVDGKTGAFNPLKSKRRVITSDGSSQKMMTLAGAGISLNSLWSVHTNLRDGNLIQVLPEFEIEDPSALWLIYPKSNALTAKVRAFMDFLIDRIGKAPPWNS